MLRFYLVGSRPSCQKMDVFKNFNAFSKSNARLQMMIIFPNLSLSTEKNVKLFNGCTIPGLFHSGNKNDPKPLRRKGDKCLLNIYVS